MLDRLQKADIVRGLLGQHDARDGPFGLWAWASAGGGAVSVVVIVITIYLISRYHVCIRAAGMK
jgi:hypothetical protein